MPSTLLTSIVPRGIYETHDEVVVKASLPGVKPGDIDISVTGQLLTLTAQSQEEHATQAKAWYRHEHRSGTFLRQLTLPTEVESDKSEAVLQNGVLTLRLPKAEAMKPKQITVRVGDGSGQMIEAKTS